MKLGFLTGAVLAAAVMATPITSAAAAMAAEPEAAGESAAQAGVQWRHIGNSILTITNETNQEFSIWTTEGGRREKTTTPADRTRLSGVPARTVVGSCAGANAIEIKHRSDLR